METFILTFIGLALFFGTALIFTYNKYFQKWLG